MLRFLLVRIASSVPVLFVSSVVTFAIIQAPPGDYSDYIRSQAINQGGASFEQADAQAQAYKVANGLDKPMVVQYVNWITGIVTSGDFGHSLFYNRPVADVVAERLPRTLALALVCHILASVIGITFGILAATRQYTWVDTVLSGVSFLGMTVPRFLMALIIVYILVFHFNVSDINSFHSARYGGAPWSWDKFVDLLKHVWPVIAIATFGGLAYNMRVMRGNLLDTLNAQYVETARAKGLGERKVILHHAVPNAIHPLVMYQGVVLPYMPTGEIETAIIFALPTVGPGERRDLARHTDKPVIDARNVAVEFKVEHGTVSAVKDVSFQLYRGETIAIVGESGSGKSVTARTVMGLLSKRAMTSPHSTIAYKGENVLKFSENQRRKLRGDRIAMIFQEPMSSLNPVYTIGTQIVEAIRVHRRMSRKAALAEALDLLRHVQIPEPEARLNQYPHQLSGGQRQRIMIARAIALEPEFILLDEPTSALDLSVQAQIIDLLRKLQAERGLSYLFISHDLKVVRALCHRVAVMQSGSIVEEGPVEDMLSRPETAYTERLVRAVFDVAA